MNRVMPQYYPPNQRRGLFSQEPRRGAFPSRGVYGQNFGPQNDMRRPNSPYLYNQEPPQGFQQQPQRYQQQSQGYQQPPQRYQQQSQGYQQQPQKFQQQQGQRRFPENLNTMMNHAGKVSEGINLMRQIGSFFNLFR